MRQVVSDLVESRQYEEVITCIEQAILQGQIQPWMHQILALAMQATGRPNSQIERVLLSSQDVVLNDPKSMVHLAACLVSFDRFDRAIELYRQAAALNPSRPEPYVLALELAARTKNYSAIAWSAPEVLTFSWSKGREQLNRLAEQSAAEAESAFTKAGEFAKAFSLQSEMRKARRLDLALKLEWSGSGDLDLQVREPEGSVCSLMQPMTASGGIFVHDGFGPVQEHCYEEYLCPQGIAGEYRAIISHVSGEIVGKRARLTIVRNRGSQAEEVLTETILLGPRDQTVRFSLNHGRRTLANAKSQDLEMNVASGVGGRGSVLAQIGPGGGVGQIARRGSAIGFTPIVTQVSEGVRMSAFATVSGDRRYVRINATPVFSAITDVFTFSFQQ